METTDVLIVGAGLSGIGAAVHLQRDCPSKDFVIVEAREAIGGTWDLFRYPGIRSDSDMHTLGYVFKPWTKAKAIADGPSIRDYVNETADEHGVRDRIRFGHKVVSADWSSETARWTLTMLHEGEERQISCAFLFMNSGYYNYNQGYRPEFPGEDGYEGRFVHPQHWPEDLDYKDKRVVIIGSGATAVTLVPEIAKEAAQTVMLQRSPTWMVSRPAQDRLGNLLRKLLGEERAYRLIRWKNVRLQDFFFRRARSRPEKVGEKLLEMVRKHLPADYDVKTHLTPSYNPWEERLCLVPDGDLFEALSNGSAEIVTDHIETFEAGGIRLKSGKFLQADIVVTATGLNLQLFGGAELSLDGKTVGPRETYPYKGVMFSGIPNLAATFGYTNASWTLKADITAQYVARLLNLMDEKGMAVATPDFPHGDFTEQPFSNLSSGYFKRAEDRVPRSTDKAPWQQPHDYLNDRKWLLDGEIEDGTITLSKAAAPTARQADGEVFAIAAE
ncbi:FAD-containing monooxygenase EthA [Pacificimonas flava]|uniref:FAD-containing monooxygenase EthA n=2 Tax=Pacificimonas TaxID=1960290 RepID=A0A219B423_9SPHN|nr:MULTISPECIES: NAD(P)/FAD-dependent oxidoreductase [Pacificimonas]MBZ6377266.1 NAD(P)/FAD-dependent oxidoreductase [Pacificimonas aurantium]OWV33021.1 FAD-containing monooxygenase EthA [Pacificimonas flava]